jgi:G protein-coupled receptor 139
MGNYATSLDNTDIPELTAFSNWYKPIHGYLAAIVCVFGVVANILNIIVLTRKNMQSSTNVILTGLAITDGLTMAAYFPWALQMYVVFGVDPNPARDTLACARFQMGYAILSVTVHSISIWLTVTLAVFRYIFIRFPRRGARWCNIYRAKVAVISVVVVVTIICIPNSTGYTIIDTPFPDNNTNGTIWYVTIPEDNDVLSNFNFWVQAILIRLLPCFLLTIFSFLLVKTMRRAERRRKKLMNKNRIVQDGESTFGTCAVSTASGTGGGASGGGNATVGSNGKRSRRSVRTTRMLLCVVILFLLTETPQGILNVLSGLIDNFFHRVYSPFGDLLDIITLINGGINFVLYCTMSKQFRDTFITIFLKGIFVKYDNRSSYVTTLATRESEM